MKNNLTEKEIRDIIKDEMMRNYRSGAPMVSPHTHDGVNNLRINEKDLTFNNRFTFFTNGDSNPPNPSTATVSGLSNPSSVTFYGIAFDGRTTVTFALGLFAGQTSAVLASPWSGTTGYKPLVFSSGEQRSSLFTNGSLTVSWVAAGALTTNATNIATIASATHKAMITGEAKLGPCYQPIVTGGSFVTVPQRIENVGIDQGVFPIIIGPGIIQACNYIFVDTTGPDPSVGTSPFTLAQARDVSGNIVSDLKVVGFTNSTVTFSSLNATGWHLQGNIIIT